MLVLVLLILCESDSTRAFSARFDGAFGSGARVLIALAPFFSLSLSHTSWPQKLKSPRKAQCASRDTHVASAYVCVCVVCVRLCVCVVCVFVCLISI